MTTPQAIQRAIEQLIDDSKTNTAKIEKIKAASTTLRAEIQIFSLELSRDTHLVTTDDNKDLEASRKTASEDDCQFLRSSMDEISQCVKENRTTEALNLIEPLTLTVGLLRKRLQYIAELEQLLREYEQEKQIRAKLKAVAEVLGLPLSSVEQASSKNLAAAENEEVATLIVNPYSSEEPQPNSTLH